MLAYIMILCGLYYVGYIMWAILCVYLFFGLYFVCFLVCGPYYAGLYYVGYIMCIYYMGYIIWSLLYEKSCHLKIHTELFWATPVKYILVLW